MVCSYSIANRFQCQLVIVQAIDIMHVIDKYIPTYVKDYSLKDRLRCMPHSTVKILSCVALQHAALQEACFKATNCIPTDVNKSQNSFLNE